jgi:hypothetical protein
MKKYHFVYETINLINGKKYIGKHSTKNKNDGYLGSGIYLNRAINKYGKENFKRVILKEFDTEKEAFDYESELVGMDIVNNSNYYNIIKGGIGWTSEELKEYWKDEDLRKEMSNKIKELWKTPEFRNSAIKGMNTEEGKTNRKKSANTPECKAKKSKVLKELWKDPEYRNNVSKGRNTPDAIARRKKTYESPEYKERVSKINKEVWKDPEYRENMIQTVTTLWETPEYRNKLQDIMDSLEYKEKISKASTRLWKDPEYREKVIRRTKEGLNKPEMRIRLSEAQKEIQNRPEIKKMKSKLFTGEGNPKAKLNNKKVIEIRKRLQKGELINDIAKIYGVVGSTIKGIQLGLSWKHVTI